MAGRGERSATPEAGAAGGVAQPAASDRPDASAAWRAEVQRRLLGWFQQHRRPLPFRSGRTPYRVLVAEFMLQQTRAEAVGPFFERFVRRFPDVPALAAAADDEVLAVWQGLGYYRRARLLRAAAAEMQARHGGAVPSDPAALRALPGVGPYIAAAVGAFAFGRDEAACDANVRRVLARLCDVPRPDAALAARLLPVGRGPEWNEALMDFGSAVCIPRTPRCAACPLSDVCAGRRAGRAALLPERPPRRPRPEVVVTVLVARDAQGRFGLVRRPATGLLGGLWELPAAEGALDPDEVARRHALRLTAAAVPLAAFRHVFTHRAWTVRPFAASAAADGPEPSAVRWVAAEALAGVPLGGPSARLVAGALRPSAK